MIWRLLILCLILSASDEAQAVCVPSLSVSATTLDFGVYDPGATSSTKSTGKVTVQCLVGVLPSFSVALSTGNSGSYATRQMANGTDRLDYNLYTDSNHTMVWGDGTGTTSTASFSGLISLLSTSFVVYGRMPRAQYPAPGTFTDTITVTVTY
jgi:spore coat protein U-like protein